MPTEVIMPKVDMDMTVGRIATWHVAAGEAVEKGAPLFDIETDKAAMEVEAPGSGILRDPVAEGAEIAIGQPVAWLYAPGEAMGRLPPTPRPADDEPAPGPVPLAAEISEAEQRPDPGPGQGAIRATPRARRDARAHGLDLAQVAGSGPGGRIQAADLQALLERAPAVAVPARPASGSLAVTRSTGGTGMPVVMLHGFASDAAGWAPAEPHLDARPLIRIDLPCHGASPQRLPRDFAALAAEIRTAFDALGLERAHLLGHSLGGALALALADTRPRQIAGLTMIAPAGLGPEIDGDILSGICRATRTESLAPWLRGLVADPALITDGYARAAMAGRADRALRDAQSAMADALFPDGTQGFDLRAALERVTAPMAILWGKRDRVIPWRHALAAPGPVALHLFEGLGHLPHIEAPDRVGPLLRRTLA